MPGTGPGGFCAVDVDDVAAAHVAAETRGRVGERYLLGNHNVTFADFARLVAEVGGVARPRLYIPGVLARGAARGMELWSSRVSHREPQGTVKAIQYLQRRASLRPGQGAPRARLPLHPAKGLDRARRGVLPGPGHGLSPAALASCRPPGGISPFPPSSGILPPASMDPRSPVRMFLAPAAPCAPAARLPGREAAPSLEDCLVQPEHTRDEMIRGRRVVAMPANPPHADWQFGLGYVIGAHVKPGYVGSAELLTRAGAGSDFATDVCVRKEGRDPTSDARYLEELAFEVVNEQSARDLREKAEDLTARGVRRVIAVFVKTGKVCQWTSGAFVDLDLDGTLDDPCLNRPIRVRALLDAAEADDAVAEALADKRNPVIEALRDESKSQGKAAAILAVLAARGVAVDADTRARILGCRDASQLDAWIGKAALASSLEAVFAR